MQVPVGLYGPLIDAHFFVAPAQTAARERTQEVEMLGTMELFMWKYRGLTVDKLGLPEAKPKIDVED